jgi:hypothetical protein
LLGSFEKVQVFLYFVLTQWFVITRLMAGHSLVIGIYGYNGGVITASMAFTTISLMNLVRQPLTMISWILNSVFVDGKTSVDRISVSTGITCMFLKMSLLGSADSRVLRWIRPQLRDAQW